MAETRDLVLVHIDNKPGFYARIEGIFPDVKPGWWQVKLLVLTFPLQVYTWILDESQISGAPLTMGGTPILLEKLDFPMVKDPRPEQEEDTAPSAAKPEPATEKMATKVVSLADRKKPKS